MTAIGRRSKAGHAYEKATKSSGLTTTFTAKSQGGERVTGQKGNALLVRFKES